MGRKLGFEQKIQGLIGYYQELESMDPTNSDHAEIANPDFFYGGYSAGVNSGLNIAKESTRKNIGLHAMTEYTRLEGRALDTKDLREDTIELRAERADLLSLMTSPLTPELRDERAEKIGEVLDAISSGETISIALHNPFSGSETHFEREEFEIDATRALFGVFRNEHISSRTLHIQYDTPDYKTPREAGELVFSLDIPNMFKRDLVEPVRSVSA